MIDLGLAQKMRPRLILSVAYLDYERAVVTYVPRITHLRQTRFEVPHRAQGFEPGAFDAQGIGSIPIVKLMRNRGAVNREQLLQVEAAMKAWLGFV